MIFWATPKPKPEVQRPAAQAIRPIRNAVPASTIDVPAGPPVAMQVATTVPPLHAVSVPVVDAHPEPMQARGLHLAGCMVMTGRTSCVLTVSQNGQPVFSVTDADLVSMGYKWQRLADCVAVVTWRGRERTVICDLPQIGMAVAGASASASVQADAEASAVRTVPMPDPRPHDPQLVTVKDVVGQWRTGDLPH